MNSPAALDIYIPVQVFLVETMLFMHTPEIRCRRATVDRWSFLFSSSSRAYQAAHLILVTAPWVSTSKHYRAVLNEQRREFQTSGLENMEKGDTSAYRMINVRRSLNIYFVSGSSWIVDVGPVDLVNSGIVEDSPFVYLVLRKMPIIERTEFWGNQHRRTPKKNKRVQHMRYSNILWRQLSMVPHGTPVSVPSPRED